MTTLLPLTILNKHAISIRVHPKAVISLARIRMHKFTKDHCGTVPIGWCLLYICFFCVVLLATWATQMCKCANAQIAVPASLIC